jgi:hypothetical protein
MSEKFYTRSRTIVSFTIALLTLFSGLLGWQMGNISGEAAGEYSRAQRAELNRQKISSTNALKAYEDYRAFLVYKKYISNNINWCRCNWKRLENRTVLMKN